METFLIIVGVIVFLWLQGRADKEACERERNQWDAWYRERRKLRGEP